MPLHASRTPEGQEPLETDYVSSVDRIADTEGGTTVYDLQVEGNHNFFADGFLVHNCLTIDDPYKDAADAWSANTRKRIWDWLTTTALTRLMPGGGVLILLTSWHDDGLDNKLIRTAKETGEVWEVIDIPAIMEAGYSGRHPEDLRGAGESFWTSAWPVEELEKTRRRIGPNAWSALYQQRAIPDGGTIIERPWIKLWERQPEGLQELILSWDLAFKGNQDSSRVAGHLWGRRGGDFFMLARDTKVREFRETLSDFLAMANKYPRATVKLVEDKANGPALQSMLQHSVPGLKMVPVEKDKEGRLRAVSPVFASGNVYLPNPSIHPWAAEVIEELVRFPNSEYNDDTDALSQALAYWIVPGYGPTRWRNWTL
jgi:predicted phage terminase large subunit-like protein